ncbi:SLC13 family permease [Comamonas testosteroni]|uniref:SLC13 family permease n=1 Tax=Comamonas testosteroni TaxID=285 RepID=UPI00265E4EED|nr:SLC13 family permease [Comamonas testosteroni]WKL14533.1 L-lactate permease [Comamonas testosteroni]WQD42008.1 L-lactate permease [Comamonas testosteroni]
MYMLLSALPVATVIAALLAGWRSLHAAALGVAVALPVIALAFAQPASQWLAAGSHWTPVLLEVLLIVAGGLLLSEVLRASGAQKALADWLLARAGSGTGAVLLVVHGITPFAESVTGFGVGVTIGIPLLAHFGLPPRKVVLIGLLGLCAVPWGSMGPGTLVAATMAGLPFKELGQASALVSVIPFVITGMAAAALASGPGRRGPALLQGLLSGLSLTAAVALMNTLAGTAPAGALGALLVVGWHLLRLRVSRADADKPPLSAPGRRALAAYALLLGGVLAAAALLRILDLPAAWHGLASPGLWLLVAAIFFTRGRPARPSLAKVWRAWLQVAPVTALFIVLGVLMAVSGMAAQLAQALARSGPLYLLGAPFVGALGGFVTGSNTGANAMFAATQAEIAQALGAPLLPFMAVHNVSASLLLMASPGKVEMAVQLLAQGTAQRRWVQQSVLMLDLVAVALMGVLNWSWARA